MKFQMMLMIFLIANSSLGNEGNISGFNESTISPQSTVLSKLVKIELPLPVKTERQKFIINVTPDNGYVCHNYLRETEIKDKLFSLQTKVDTIPELEKKLLETPKPTSFIATNTQTSLAVGALLGLITGFFISKK